MTGQFDAVLSVEMIEAVGERWWPDYFRTLEERLAPSGRIGLQTILMAHDRLTGHEGRHGRGSTSTSFPVV